MPAIQSPSCRRRATIAVTIRSLRASWFELQLVVLCLLSCLFNMWHYRSGPDSAKSFLLKRGFALFVSFRLVCAPVTFPPKKGRKKWLCPSVTKVIRKIWTRITRRLSDTMDRPVKNRLGPNGKTLKVARLARPLRYSKKIHKPVHTSKSLSQPNNQPD